VADAASADSRRFSGKNEEQEEMKFPLFSRFLMLIVGGLLAAGAYAAGTSHKGNLHISDPVEVNGKHLTAGDYTVTWDGEGPDVTLHIAREHKEIAAAPAKVVSLNEKSSDDAALVMNNPSGKRDLTAVRFAGKAYELDLTGTSQMSGDGVK
jgi:hypothetical protein